MSCLISGYGRTRTRKVVKPIIKPLSKTIMHNPIISHKPAYLPKKPIMPVMPKKPVMPVLPKKPVGPVLPKPGIMPVDPIMPIGGPMGPMGGGVGLPISIQNLLGKTITGKDIIGGITNGFPRHGGAGAGHRFANGLRNGWGGDPTVSVNDLWRDPLDMQPFDPAFNGGNLVLDPARGIWAAETQQRHHVAKKTGGAIGAPAVIEHNIAKEVNHMARKTISGVGIATPIIDKKVGAGSYVGLSQLGGMGPVGTAFVDPVGPIALDHNIAKSSGMGPVGHGIAKATGGVGMVGMQHDIAKATSGVGMVGVQHDMAKATMLDVDPFGSVRHDIAKTTGMGMGPAGMQHDIAKSTGMGMGMGPAGMQHDIAKSTGMGMGMGPAGMQHDIAKSTGMGMGMGPAGMQHDIAKSTGMGMGMGPVGMQHDIAKSTGMGMGMGPAGMQHDIAKSTGMGMGIGSVGMQHDIAKVTSMAGDPFGPAGGAMGGVAMQHDIAKATSGVIGPVGPGSMMGPAVLPPIQVKKAGGDPVHNVEKVIRSGITSIGHDDLAFNIGSQLAREITHNSAKTIDMGSRGQVSAGNPIARQAVQGLAKEAVHVLSETINLAAGKPGHMGAHGIGGSPLVGGAGHMMSVGPGSMMGGSSLGLSMAGHGMVPIEPIMPIQPVMPVKPVIPKKPKIPKAMIKGGGYGRMPGRRRKKGKGLKKGLKKGLRMSKYFA